MCFKDLILTVIIFCFVMTRVNCLIKTCERTTLDDGRGVILHWAETPINSSKPSIPYCYDSDENLLERRCLEDGNWESFKPELCVSNSLEKFNGCPSESEMINLKNKKICVFISTAKKWENSCLKFGSSKSILEYQKEEIIEILHYLSENKILQEFWLPLKREQKFQPFKWQQFGEKWSSSFEMYNDFKLKDNYNDKCLKFIKEDAENWTLKSENCKNNLSDVCLFEYHENSLIQSSCENGFTTRSIENQNSCFEIEKTSLLPQYQFKTFEITRKNSYLLLKNLMKSARYKLKENDKCLIDVGSFYSEFFNKTYGNYSVIDRNGKWFNEKNFSCIIHEKSVDLQLPILDLKFDSCDNRLILAIYSEDSLLKIDKDYIKCYTSSTSEFIKRVKIKRKIWKGAMLSHNKLLGSSRMRNNNMTKTIYQLKVETKGAGIFWCEGHQIKTLKFIRSKNVLAKVKKNQITLAMNLSSMINVKNDKNPIYSSQSVKKTTDQLKSALKSLQHLTDFEEFILQRIDDIYIMRILDYNAKLSKVTAIYHIVISNKEQNSSEEDSYEDFMDKYAHKFNDSKFHLDPNMIVDCLNRMMSKLSHEIFTLNWIHSTEFCLPTFIEKPTSRLMWDVTIIGQRMPPRELCLRNNGLPVTRKCMGNFESGGRWENLSDKKSTCVDERVLKAHTKILHNMSDINNTNAIDKMTLISSHFEQLIPADLFYISKNILNMSSYDNFDLENMYNLTIILNNVMNVNEKFIQLSQIQLNTSNILLDSYDNLINSLSTSNYSIYNTLNHNSLMKKSSNDSVDDGTLIIQTEKIILFFCSPDKMNVSGLALVRKEKNSDKIESLTDFDVEKLYSHQSLDDILNIYQDSLEIASFFPKELLDQIDNFTQLNLNSSQNSSNPLRIVMKIFYDDKMFQESSEVTTLKAQSKIISVTIPNIQQDLPSLLPLIFRKSINSETVNEDICGYWDFHPNGTDSSDSSEWNRIGCSKLEGNSLYYENFIICGCAHMTHFAYLITGTYVHDHNPDVIITPLHSKVLDTITIFGSSLSILGIIGIFITAFCFKTWREKNSTKVLLQLSMAIILQMTIFIFFSTEKYNYTIDTIAEQNVCIILGASLHYSVLVTFAWMLITAFLQFKRYVVVLGNVKPERFFLKAFLVGWGIPFIPVLSVLIINPLLYIPEEFGICYPQGIAFYFGILLPVGLIVIANLIVFIMVIHNILKSGPSNNMRTNERGMILSQVRVSIFLFFLLGLTWIFGFIASSRVAILFSYLFCLTATIQGFILFIYFIIMDPITRKLWRESFRTWKN